MNVKKLSIYALIPAFILLIIAILSLQFSQSIPGYLFLIVAMCFFGFFLFSHFSDFRQLFKRKSMRQRTENSVILLLTLVLLLGVYLCFYFELFSFRLDLTKTKLFSLSEQTMVVVRSLKGEVKVYAFDRPGRETPVKEMIMEYQRSSDLIEVVYVDAHKRPDLAQKYSVELAGTYVFTMEGRSAVKLRAGDFVSRTYDSYGQPKTEFRIEEKVTSVLQSFNDSKKHKIYFLIGHGERRITDKENNGMSEVREVLKLENMVSQELDLLKTDTIPDDATLLVIPGPKGGLSGREIEIIKTYVDLGGELLVLLDPLPDTKGNESGLAPLFKTMGIIVREDVVIDQQNFLRQFANRQGAPFIPRLNYGEHSVVRSLKQRELPTFFFSTRSFALKETQWELTPVLESFETGYGETTLLSSGNTPALDHQKDFPGPVTVGVLASRKNENDQESRVAVFGDSGFAANTVIGLAGHKDLISNTVSWLVRKKSDFQLSPKQASAPNLFLTPLQEINALIFFVILLPGLFFVLALMTLLRNARGKVG